MKANTQCFITNHTSPVTTHAQVNTSDFSSNQWMTCFQDTGAEILGCSAQELGEMKEQNSPEYDSVFQKANFKAFMFRVRAKMDTYNVSSLLQCVKSMTITSSLPFLRMYYTAADHYNYA